MLHEHEWDGLLTLYEHMAEPTCASLRQDLNEGRYVSTRSCMEMTAL